jgi:Fe-S cluster assembly scaffold protein SufB
MDRLNSEGAKMLDNLFKRLNKPKNINIKENKAKMEKKKVEELELEKERLTKKIEEIKEFEKEVGALLPFEEIDLKEKELKLTEIKKRIVYEEIIKLRNSNKPSTELDTLFKKLNNKILKIKEELQNISSQARTKSYNGLYLYPDPRLEIKKEIFNNNKHKKIINELVKHESLVNSLIASDNKINSMLDSYEKLNKESLMRLNFKNYLEGVNELKNQYSKKAKTKNENKLKALNKKLDKIREELAKSNRVKEFYS